jgi:hypothetical protein
MTSDPDLAALPPARVPEEAAKRLETIRDSEAEYALEYPATCPRCGQELTFLKAARLLRTRVHFVSVLPRRGRVLTCPHCRTILSAELTLA